MYGFIQWRAKWETDGLIIVDNKSAYAFLKALQSKDISLTSFEPAFRDVVAGVEEYTLVPASMSFSQGNAKKFLTALGALQKHQMTILNQDVYLKIRDHNDIERWLTNMSTSEVNRKEG